MDKLTSNDYKNALDVQSACNLQAVINSFARVLPKIAEEGKGKGTDWINTHPICRLYAEQIAFLSGGGMPSNGTTYANAYEIAEVNSNK